MTQHIDREDFLTTCSDFWRAYYSSMLELHQRQGRALTEPLRDRNLGTTDSKHIAIFENFWRTQLADALGVSYMDVNRRTVAFRPHRSKSFDVCWPLTGEPKILISVKSMQNAYRNFTNRIEEAFGDSAVLRLYRSNAVFGFFFFMLDGNVARGAALQGKTRDGDAESGKGKGIAPYLDLVEEGGDFFDLSDAQRYAKEPIRRQVTATRGRQDTIRKAEQSLIDLAATQPTNEGGIHYDAIAFTPVRCRNSSPTQASQDWEMTLSQVDPRLDYNGFLSKLLETARLRKLI